MWNNEVYIRSIKIEYIDGEWKIVEEYTSSTKRVPLSFGRKQRK